MIIHKIQVITRSVMLAVLFMLPTTVIAVNPADSLRKVLAAKTTAADSVPVLFNLYEVSYFTTRAPILEAIYNASKHSGNDTGMYEAIFLMAAYHEQDAEKEAELLRMADAIGDHDRKDRIKLYVRLRYDAYEIKNLTEDERRARLIESLTKYKEMKNLELYDRIEYLFSLCCFLRNTTDSELLVSYLHELRGLIEALPEEELPLRALFYTQAATSFFNNGLYEDAVMANKEMLEVNRRFDKAHEAQGREFRNYDGSTYLCYHNMLMCYDVLSDKEIDEYYSRMLELAKNNDRLKKNANLQRQSNIVYLMAKKRYKEAIPLIETQLIAQNAVGTYGYFVKSLAKAARAVGDDDALLHALQIRNTLLRERLENNSDLSLQELQTIYEVDRLRNMNQGLNNERESIDVDHKRKLSDWIIVGAALLVLSIIWLLIMYSRSRSLVKKLYVSHRRFLKERNALKDAQKDLIVARDKAKGADKIKSDFVNNMSDELRDPLSAIVEYSHLITDYASEDDRSYISEYSDKLDLNTDMLITLVNDVLDLPSMENGELNVRIAPVSVKKICDFTLDIVSKHLSPDVRMVFLNENDSDVLITTDSNKVEQILIHMLVNAAKFTKEGTITFGYEIDDDHKQIIFTVTDTGIGIPRGQEEVIFERFHKVDPSTQGNGLGLYIGRLLARMLKGELKVDKEYRSGARFSLTIPIV